MFQHFRVINFKIGLFAPHWRDDARGTLVGLTQYTNREHICRAVLEAVSFQTRDIMDSMERDSETEIHLLKVDGGMSMSNELMQIQADIAGVELVRPEMSESTAIGAAYAAGLAVNVWTSEHELPIDSNADTFKPNMDQQKRLEMRKFWAKAIEKSFNWA